MLLPSAILIVSGAVASLWMWRTQASDRLHRDAVVKDLKAKLRYLQNEVDALSKFNDELLESLRKEKLKNSVLMEECKSFAASVVYWKRQSENAVLDDE